ncbi:hypothetical protein PILCRDRAFT_12084 [Piloderma croceum F 1598]|uniref:DUF4139 domain-containing protein n=1 Tax=Piloderma croceum (strain F 1598) TaxID=765440 RepID=A0A0C3BJA7_PILCF|nr:hypothetical protein PILCRDRAFT_12084 [Piloderma croceum F 1598]
MEHEADLLVTYAKTLNGEHVTPTAMIDFLKTFVDKGRENLKAVTEIDKNILEVNRMIERESAKVALKIGEANGQATIVVVASEDSKVEMKLTYIVSGVSWHPTYELHASTENGKPSSVISLHYRARIQQSTGEDWKNSALMLSTVASDMFAKSVPHLRMSKIDLGKPHGLFGQKNPLLSNTNNGFVNNASIGLMNNANVGFAKFAGPPNAFGQPQQQQQQQQSLFSQLATPPAPAAGFGAFGAPPASSGLFGVTPASAGGALFGGAPYSNAFGGGSTSGGAFGGSSFGASIPPTAAVHAAVLSQPEDDTLSSFEEITSPGPFSEPTTIVTESPLSATYAVEGESTIPSDGVAHQVSIAVLSFESKVTHVCCPKIEARVYLQCEVKNTSEFRLLPGPVSVFLDDSYVSKTLIQNAQYYAYQDINPSDTFDCTLGADPATRLSYSRSFKTVRNSGGTFAEVSNTTIYTNTTTIHNKHRFPLSEIIIRDVIPISQDKRVKVHLRKPDGLVNAKDGQVVDLKKLKDGLKVRWSSLVDGKGGEKEGRFEFMWKVDAGVSITVQSEWEVKAPADVDWHESSPTSLFGQ